MFSLFRVAPKTLVKIINKFSNKFFCEKNSEFFSKIFSSKKEFSFSWHFPQFGSNRLSFFLAGELIPSCQVLKKV